MVVAPEDGVERPQRGHQRAAGESVVAIEDLPVRRPVDDVVRELRRIEVEARPPAEGDRVVALRDRIRVDAVFPRRRVKRRTRVRPVAAWTVTDADQVPVRATRVEIDAGCRAGKAPDAVDVLALINK